MDQDVFINFCLGLRQNTHEKAVSRSFSVHLQLVITVSLFAYMYFWLVFGL